MTRASRQGIEVDSRRFLVEVVVVVVVWPRCHSPKSVCGDVAPADLNNSEPVAAMLANEAAAPVGAGRGNSDDGDECPPPLVPR